MLGKILEVIMKCYLHIGTEKTGTTTIQAFFSTNRKQLAERGYYYPESVGLPNNRFLPVVAYNSSKRDEFTNKLGIFSDEELIELQKKTIQTLKLEISKLPPDTTVVFSSEHIQSRLTTIQEIQALKNILNEVGFDDITVIVYFRNPAETANSLFSTAIKTGSTDRTVPPPTNTYYENICNHKKTVEKFTSVFSKDKVVIRLFRKDKLINHSLIHDILHSIGLNFNITDLTIPKNQNESLSLLGLMILRNLNEKISQFNVKGADNQRRVLAEFVSKHFSEPKFVMDKNSYQAYDAYFMESNQWIRDNYFPEETELFPYEHPTSSQFDISEDMVQQITDFTIDLWAIRSNVLSNKWYNFGKQTNKQKLILLCKYVSKKLKNHLTLAKKS